MGAGLTAELAQQFVEQYMATPNNLRRTIYASCWRLGNHESEAMWRLYCGTREGAALVLPYERLKSSLTDPRTYIGQVKYIDYDRDVIRGDNVLNQVMHKRREFEHEREARIVSWQMISLPNEPARDFTNPPPAISLRWEPEQHLERIVISPYADPWYLETIRDTVARISPDLVARVVASSMGEAPDY